MRVLKMVVLVALVGSVLASGIDAEAKKKPPIPFASCPLTADQAGRTYKLTGQPLSCAADGITVTAKNITIDLGGFVLDGSLTGSGIKAVGTGPSNLKVRNGTVQEFDTGMEIDMFNTSSATITDISVVNNVNNGIFLNGTAKPHVLTRVVAYSNGANGVLAQNGARVTSSTAVDNTTNGFSIGGPGSRVVRSVASNNKGPGITISSPGALVLASTATANGFTTVGVGMQITGAKAKVINNVAVGNALHGITAIGDKLLVHKNRADGNGWQTDDTTGLGLEVTSAPTPAKGTNRAQGNDDPNQCIPVTLC